MVAGWAIIGLMAYLIVVTARTVPKIWNPYDILGISDVRKMPFMRLYYANKVIVCKREADQVALQATFFKVPP